MLIYLFEKIDILNFYQIINHFKLLQLFSKKMTPGNPLLACVTPSTNINDVFHPPIDKLVSIYLRTMTQVRGTYIDNLYSNTTGTEYISSSTIDTIIANNADKLEKRMNESSDNIGIIIIKNPHPDDKWLFTHTCSTITQICVDAEMCTITGKLKNNFNEFITDKTKSDGKYYPMNKIRVIFYFSDRKDFIKFLDNFVQQARKNKKIELSVDDQKKLCDYDWNDKEIVIRDNSMKNHITRDNIQYVTKLTTILYDYTILENSGLTQLKLGIIQTDGLNGLGSVLKSCVYLKSLTIDFMDVFVSSYDSFKKLFCLGIEYLYLKEIDNLYLTHESKIDINEIIHHAFIENKTIKTLKIRDYDDTHNYNMTEECLKTLQKLQNVTIILCSLNISMEYFYKLLDIVNENNIVIKVQHILILDLNQIPPDDKLCSMILERSKNYNNYLLLVSSDLSDIPKYELINNILKMHEHYRKTLLSLL